MTTFLDRVVAERRADARAAAARRAAADQELVGRGQPTALESAIADAPAPRSLAQAIERRRPDHLAVIAELKRRSPGTGEIFRQGAGPPAIPGELIEEVDVTFAQITSTQAERVAPQPDVVALARSYEAAGAAAISVLTEPRHWGGSLKDLRAVRSAVKIPVLCKDVIVDVEQIYEARAAGADAVLLIAEALADHELTELSKAANLLGMEVLVEAHDPAAFGRAVGSGARIVGANARDLREPTFIDRSRARLLHSFVRSHQIFVAESGIGSVDDMAELPARTDAILVGSALMRSADPGALIAQLAAAKRPGSASFRVGPVR